MDLSTLVKMSNTYGSNPAYVLAGGGNTSVKDETTLYVKGSGTQLATIKAVDHRDGDRRKERLAALRGRTEVQYHGAL